MSALSQPLTLRGITLKNRIMISPMCTYRALADGMANDWHFVHYGKLALGGAGIVMLEATSVTPEGRHCYSDLGIWSDAHIPQLARIAKFITDQGSTAAIQLQHTGRKASSRRPWHGAGALDGEDIRERNEHPWQAVAPSAIPYGADKPVPRELSINEMHEISEAFVAASLRAVKAGFGIIEVHAAHGYLLNQFLSPIANQRTDDYGGTLENRMRFPLQILASVRAAVPDTLPVFVRISAVDGVEQGWSLEESVVFANALKGLGIDVVDCSSGGIGGAATMNRLARSPGFQVPFAAEIKHKTGIRTAAVGLILTPEQAEDIAASEQADIVAIGREALLDPNWPNSALTTLSGRSSYDHWQPNLGWWLERRAGILSDYEKDKISKAKDIP